MTRGEFLYLVLASLGLGFGADSSVLADVTHTGSVAYDQTMGYCIGYTSDGTVRVDGGSALAWSPAYIGYGPGCTGAATVTGVGSTWTNDFLYVNLSGNGTLTVADGGLVTTANLYASLSDLFGDGTITATQGAVLDVNLVFDGTQGSTRVFPFGTGGTLNVTFGPSGNLGVGLRGNHTLGVSAGAKVACRNGYLGVRTGSSGTATVAGLGSTWTMTSGEMVVGISGSGALNIQGGGQVQVSYGDAHLGRIAGSSGAITVSGAGSTWTAYGAEVYIGESGSGTVNVQDGGQVQVSYGDTSLGDYAGSNGAVTLDGFGTAWTSNYQINVGSAGTGALVIRAGAQMQSTGPCYVGYYAGSKGTATITGANSLWNCLGLGVGHSGSGAVDIRAGGQVVSGSGSIGYDTGSLGTVTVTGAGSLWSAGMLDVGHSGQATLSVQDGGQVAASSYSYIGHYSGSTGTVTVAGNGSVWTNSDQLMIAYDGSGTLNLQAGGQMRAGNQVSIGSDPGSRGVVHVTGAGSTWTIDRTLYLGVQGNGTLSVDAGGKVISNYIANIGNSSGSIGTATVTGADSTWTNSGTLYVGGSGTGRLTVADGGKVTAYSLTVGSHGSVKLDITGNDLLVLGNASTSGSVSNNGSVSFYADAFLPAAAYTPISDCLGRNISWSGTGSVNAFGGRWDPSAKTFSVAAPTALAAGSDHTVIAGERLLVTDQGSGQEVGITFGSVTGSPKFSASLMSQSELDALQAMAGLEGSVRSAWVFDTTFSGEALVSFDIGRWASNLKVWHYDGSVWTPYATDLLTYYPSGTVDFNVTGFSGYAVSAVPEPATLALLGLGGLAMLRQRRAA